MLLRRISRHLRTRGIKARASQQTSALTASINAAENILSRIFLVRIAKHHSRLARNLCAAHVYQYRHKHGVAYAWRRHRASATKRVGVSVHRAQK